MAGYSTALLLLALASLAQSKPTDESPVQPTVATTNEPSSTEGATQETNIVLSQAPTGIPSERSTVGLTGSQTQGPTASPTQNPTEASTQGPTARSTEGPTQGPTQSPNQTPTDGSTQSPNQSHKAGPTQSTTQKPTAGPPQWTTLAPTAGTTQKQESSSTSAPCPCDVCFEQWHHTRRECKALDGIFARMKCRGQVFDTFAGCWFDSCILSTEACETRPMPDIDNY